MKANIGSADKFVRLGLAIVLIILFYNSTLTGTLGIVALLVALILTITSLVNFCPIYSIFKFNTLGKKEKK